MTLVKTIACSVALMALAANAQAGETLDSVKKKGFVQCGVSTGIAGFSLADSKGVWSGIDVDIKNCEGKGDLVDRSIPTIVGATVACPSIGRTTDNEFRVSIASTTTSPVGSE